MTDADRVLAYLAQRTVCDPTTGCWVWTKSLRSKGYAAAYIFGRQWDGHRLSYIYLVGDPGPGSVVHHTCVTGGPCVNPAHLQAVTQAENTAEMLERRNYLRRIAALEAEVERLLALVAQDARSVA